MTLLATLWQHVKAVDGKNELSEQESEAHRLYRSEPGHAHKGDKRNGAHQVNGITSPGSTVSVLYVSERAAANGWSAGHPEWANFGQGAPEVGDIPGQSPRVTKIDINEMGLDSLEYAPTTGVTELRQAVADLYNKQYRQSRPGMSQYTKDNVCITPGGRAGLTRVASVIDDVFLSYQVPDYTAYDQMLSSFNRLVPIPSALDAAEAYQLDIKKLRKNVKEQGLSVVLASNPRNPTGQVLAGDDLQELVSISHEEGTTLILDEFYSWYQYELEEGATVSAASFVQNVDEDNVILIDGLTKNWRLPGWRCAWVVGPKALISALGQCGGYLDGGASHPLQIAAIPLLDHERVKQDRIALQRHFKQKRDHVLKRLTDMGFELKNTPTSTFYLWLDLSKLPSPLNSGLIFFEELLKERVICVPGIFFDINPSHRRDLFDSPCHHFIRLSFGPALEELDRGLDGIERLFRRVAQEVEAGKNLHDVVGRDLELK